MIREAIILAGGFGTRLRDVVSDLPKPMAPVNGKPFLHYLFRYLKHYGVQRVVLSTGYLAEKIEAHFGNRYENISIQYAREETPLGTGGGIRMALEKCTDEIVLVLNGDSFLDVDLEGFYIHHFEQEPDASLAIRQVEDAARYGTLEIASNRVLSFREKSPEISGPAWINGGVYLLQRRFFLSQTPAGKNFSIEQDFFAPHTGSMHFLAYPCSSYFIDIGIPADYHRAQDEFAAFRY